MSELGPVEMMMVDNEQYIIPVSCGVGDAFLMDDDGANGVSGVSIIFFDQDLNTFPLIFHPANPILDFLVSDEFKALLAQARQKSS